MQITVRLNDNELRELDKIAKKEGIENRSEIVRKCIKLYLHVKVLEEQGKVLMLVPKEQAQNSATQILI